MVGEFDYLRDIARCCVVLVCLQRFKATLECGALALPGVEIPQDDLLGNRSIQFVGVRLIDAPVQVFDLPLQVPHCVSPVRVVFGAPLHHHVAAPLTNHLKSVLFQDAADVSSREDAQLTHAPLRSG